MNQKPNFPRVVVLLAVYNGAPWLDEQIASILAQQGVEVEIIASDDFSTDGSLSILRRYEAQLANFRVVCPAQQTGSAGKNFFHLLDQASKGDGAFFAFCDQDDIWLPFKLSQQMALLADPTVVGTSTAVVQFTNYTDYKYLTNFETLTAFDFLFQSPGQGCTYLFRRALLDAYGQVAAGQGIEGVHYHDWLLYAIARSSGMGWQISPRATLLYRQHGSNELGSRHGYSAIRQRYKKVQSGWFRAQVRAITRVAVSLSSDPNIAVIGHVVLTSSPYRKWQLLRDVGKFRRDGRGRLALAFFILAGLV